MSRAAGDRRTRAQVAKVAPPRQGSGTGATTTGGLPTDHTANRVTDDLSRTVNALIDQVGDFDFGELP